MYKKILSMALVFIMAFSVVGCAKISDDNGNNDSTPSVAYINEAGKVAPLSVHVTDEGVMASAVFDSTYADKANEFAKVMINAQENDWTGVFSPLSLQIALQILALGGDETTTENLLNAVCPGMTKEDVDQSCAKLISMLLSTKGFTMNNAVISNKALRVCRDFAENAANYYNASVGALDFSKPEAALKEINGWIENNTDGLIKELLDQVSADTAVVILNALTLKLEWNKPFTVLREQILFTASDGSSQGATALKLIDEFEYGKFDEGEMVILPYKGGEYAMAMILPSEGMTPASAASALIGRQGGCEYKVVSIKMPKIEVSTKLDILAMADKLNIDKGVGGSFPNLVDDSFIHISQIVHGATLSVTESGTTAAAATAIVASRGVSLQHSEVDLVFDRPYAMVIYHVETGAVMFVSIINSIPA